MLNDTQVDRYSRQIILPEVGGRGQEKLLSSTFAIVDSTDGQSLLPLYLAAAGIGRLLIWRPGSASISQSVRDVSDLNPDCTVEAWTQPASQGSCESLIAATHPIAVIFMEGAIELAQQVNVACVRTGTPFIWGCITGASAYLSVFDPCLHPGCRACAIPPLECGDDGVLQQLATATLASQLASEAIKLALGGTSPLAGRIVHIDVAAAAVTSLPFASNPDCAVCSRGRRP